MNFKEEFIFSDIVKDYNGVFSESDNLLQEMKNNFDSGILKDKTTELTIIINRKLKNKMEYIQHNFHNIKTYFESYIKNMEQLNKGFVNNNVSVDNMFFIEAKNLLESEL